jgi:RNA polymerase sigma-70 factor (ECF subfamily)
LTDYKRPLYNHIRNIVLDHDDTNDVLQNTFIKVFQNLNNFKGESKLYSWMYRIATNESITFINKKTKLSSKTSQELKSKIVENLEADIHFDGNAIQIKLQKAILTLPEKQQLVFKMRYFEEIKYQEMSTILGTSVGALKASYHLAVKKIEIFMTKD